MRNNVIVKKNDYERYKIPISFFYLFPKSKKNYIWEELEKRHPCFSDDFCYSSKNCFSKKGFFSDVVVMEKSKLAEYKNKCSFSGNLFLEDSNKRKIFKNKKGYSIYIILASFLFLLILFLIKLLLFSRNKTSVNSDTSGIDKIVIDNNQQEVKDYIFFDKQILEKIFDISRNNNGKITALSWKLDYSGEKVFCNLENIYPEQLEAVFPELEIPVVKYKEKMPLIEFNFINHFFMDHNNVDNKNIPFNTKKVLRTFLKKNNVEISEETTLPYSIVFEWNFDMSSEDNIFIKLDNLISSLNLYVIGINFTSSEHNSGKQKVNLCITFSNNIIYKNNILCCFGKNIDLFFNHQVEHIIPIKSKSDIFSSNKSMQDFKDLSPIDGTKVGEIIYKNGKKVMFFKNIDGKISKKETIIEG